MAIIPKQIADGQYNDNAWVRETPSNKDLDNVSYESRKEVEEVQHQAFMTGIEEDNKNGMVEEQAYGDEFVNSAEKTD